MKSTANTVDQYINELLEDRRDAINKIRKIILKNIKKNIVSIIKITLRITTLIIIKKI